MSPAGATDPVIADESWQIAAADASATPTELRAEASDGSLTLSVVREYNGEPTFSSIEIGSQNELSSVLAELEKDASVIAMEPEVMFRATSSATLSNSIVRTAVVPVDLVDLGTIESTNQGAGIITAVIDSGVDSRHVALASQVLNGVDYYDGVSTLTGGCTSFDAATYPRWQGDTNVKPNHAGFGKFDPEGHGTHVAGIIAANGFGMTGVAPESKILPVRVLGADGSGDSTDVACGIKWAADNGADIINMSLGSDIDSLAVNVAVKYALSKDVVVLAAAGNDGPINSPSYPAATNTSASLDSPVTYDVIAVGATDSTGNIQAFSNRGSYVDFAAPGVDILSTCMATPVFSDINDLINSCDTKDGSDRYESLSGTSMATPHVAGVVALIMSANPGISYQDVTQTLINIAVDKGEQGLDSAYGYGFIKAPAATTRNSSYAISTLTSNAHSEELRLTDLANAEAARLAQIERERLAGIERERLAQIKRDAAAAARLASLPVVRASLSVKVLKKKRISISVAAPAGAKTTIQRKVGKKWRKISTRYTLPNSIIKLRKAGTYRVKIVLPTGTITTKSYKVK